MISAVRIRGLGPHDDTHLELDARGMTELVGPSQAGKSTLIDAVTWCLWGVTADGRTLKEEVLRDGAEVAEVELVLGSGTRFMRRLHRGGRPVREKNGTPYSTEQSWKDALGPLGRTTDLLRVTMAPLAWVPLAQGPGGGRPLRDLLTNILPTGSLREVVEEILGAPLRPTDSISEQEAYRRRTEQNRKVDELVGRAAAAAEVIERISQQRVEQPLPSTVQGARATLDAAEGWLRYRACEGARNWDERRQAVGDRPDDSEHLAKVAKKRESAAAAKAKVEELREQIRSLEAQAPAPERVDRSELDRLTMESEGSDTCHACGQRVPDAATRRQAALAALDAARRNLEAAELEAKRRHQAAEREHHRQVGAVKADWQLALKRSQDADRALEALLSKSPAAEWEAAVAALGPRPLVTMAPLPDAVEPTAEQVAEARAVMAAVQAAAGARRQQEAERTRAIADGERVAALQREAEAEAERLDRLVAAVREAPSRLAARQVQALGDLGPVRLHLPEGSSGVDVLVDGRPWWTASRGRLVVADLHFRAALRRALKLPWLALFVDNVQDWSGELPAVGGPVVLLRTGPVDSLVRVAA